MEDLVIRCKEEKCWGRLIKKVITRDDILKFKELESETELVENDLFWVCDNLSEQEDFQEMKISICELNYRARHEFFYFKKF